MARSTRRTAGASTGGGEDRDDLLSRAFSDAAAGKGVLLILLLTAFAWGALHALSPGHGKAMVAAYLVGTRGTARHAVALGATVTVTHTAGVFLLGVVALGLSEYVLPEDLYPWLNLISGLMVLGVGAYVLRKNVLRRTKHTTTTTITTITIRMSCRGAASSRWARRPGSSRARPRSWSCSAQSRRARSRSGC